MYRLKMCLQKSNLFTAIFLWRRLACSLLAALRFVSPWHPLCPVLNALYTRPLSIFSYLLFSPAVFNFSFLFAPLDCSADPPFGVPTFRTRQESGLSSSGWLRCQSSSDPPVRLCRGESHSGASLALSPLLLALVPFSLLFLRIRLFATLPPFPQLYCFLFIPFFY